MLDAVAILQRLNFAADYFAQGHSDRTSELSFAKDNLFDILGCTYLSVWEMDDNGGWRLYSDAGDSCDLPKDFTSWSQLSRLVVGAQHAQCWCIGDGTYHWSLPLRTNAGRNFVAHLRGTVGGPDELAVLFLSVCAKLLVSLHQQPGGGDSHIHGLSQRQEEILTMMANGKTYGQIASTLGYSESLVKQEAVKICKRLGAKSRYEAVEMLRSSLIHS